MFPDTGLEPKRPGLLQAVFFFSNLLTTLSLKADFKQNKFLTFLNFGDRKEETWSLEMNIKQKNNNLKTIY